MTELDDLVDDLLREGLGDWTMLVDIVRRAEVKRPDDGRAAGRQLVSELVEGGWMIPGDLGKSGFEPWDSTPVESVRRIFDDLDAHDWDVMKHSLFWFENTSEGDERARG